MLNNKKNSKYIKYSIFLIIIILIIFTVILCKNGLSQKNISSKPPTTKNLELNIDKHFGFTHIPENLLPTWIPEGYSYDDIDELETDDMKMIRYFFRGENEKELISIFVFYLYNDIKINYEKDDSPVETFNKDGLTYYLMGNVNTNTFIWRNGSFECQVDGTVSRDELKQMIDSIPSK